MLLPLNQSISHSALKPYITAQLTDVRATSSFGLFCECKVGITGKHVLPTVF